MEDGMKKLSVITRIGLTLSNGLKHPRRLLAGSKHYPATEVTMADFFCTNTTEKP